MDYNIKSIKEDFKSKGIFYTTSELAEYMKSLIDIEFDEVYDPTCGDGSLLSVFSDNIKKYGQEINDHQLEVAENRLINFTGYCGDTLKEPAFFDKKFMCIVANPPFSIAWDPPLLNGMFTDDRFRLSPALPPKGKADYAFMLHILHYLSEKGIAIVLNFPGVLYRGNSEYIIRKWLVETNVIDKIIRIPGKTFVDTTIETVIVIFRKNKKNTDIEFIDNETKLSKVVSIDEIRNNDYTISVSCFVINEKIKEYIDPIELHEQARIGMIRKLKQDIEMDKMICELEGFDFHSYLLRLQNAVSFYSEP